MLNADALVFVPRKSSSDNAESERSEDYLKGEWHHYTDEACSTAAPSMAGATDGEPKTSSPFWDLQEAPSWEHWENSCQQFGQLPDPAADDCGEVFAVPDITSIAVPDISSIAVPDITSAAGATLAAAENSAWDYGIAAAQNEEMDGLLEELRPFASSCATARRLAPRPEGMGPDPLLVCVGEVLDGFASLVPVVPDYDDTEAPPLTDDYVLKVTIYDALHEQFQRWSEEVIPDCIGKVHPLLSAVQRSPLEAHCIPQQ